MMGNSMYLNIIPEERLALIPEEYWQKHEFCFHLHDQLLHLLKQYEESGAHSIVENAFHEAARGKEKELEDLDILQFMKTNNLIWPYKHHILSHTILGLTSDLLNFLYESLRCFEKRKFSVAFSLLRKPLKEHLLFLSWIIAYEDDFISRFEENNHISFNGIFKKEKIDIFDKAIKKLHLKEAFDAETIWSIIYSKTHSNGFEPTWQRATHLTTSRGDLLKTEDYSFNFIFESPWDDQYYDFVYWKLPLVLLFLTQILFECFNRIHPTNKKTISYNIITAMGAYEAIFLDGRANAIRKSLQNQLGDLLSCVQCDEKFKINKANAADFFLTERVNCRNCGITSQFPLYWILAKANISFIETE
ncbi:hypothetical protein QPM17_11425 [Marinobacter sp. TBZ242]|uniref:Uncharacterized protein n=1 Tax=Marinobacter azerbaijanicus TaxID=3050455 RepID=A0ABT7IDJ7_9GAMM|nr:hypothetical protein [Marinobacter sp. TBZ242]MDL0431743.1 hypothetical protein [Marinobacter sp. TBZ242]